MRVHPYYGMVESGPELLTPLSIAEIDESIRVMARSMGKAMWDDVAKSLGELEQKENGMCRQGEENDKYVTSDSATTHVMVQTLCCGDIIAPLAHISLHKVGDTCRLLVRDDTDWREIAGATYNYLKALIDYA